MILEKLNNKFLIIQMAFRHLMSHKRSTGVSISGIAIGVSFFLAISSLMKGSEDDLISRLVNNSPHINIVDEYRNPSAQPIEQAIHGRYVSILKLKPEFENRGIRTFRDISVYLSSIPNILYANTVSGKALVNSSGKTYSVTVNGMHPTDIESVTTIGDYMILGKIKDIIGNSDGIIVGQGLLDKISASMGDNINITSVNGLTQTFKIVGYYSTGRSNVDNSYVFMHLKKAQNLLGYQNRINSVIIKLDNPMLAEKLASTIESNVGYKCISWQEDSRDLMNTIYVRNVIMLSVVSAVLIVATFGIYNVISTVVLEKVKDIAIMNAMGFQARDIKYLFLWQGIIIGLSGAILGLGFGAILMHFLGGIQIKPPGSSQLINIPIAWELNMFAIASGFALIASVLAAFLPSRKAAQIDPILVLRGGML